MPSTRGMGSKMICCCSLELFGVIPVKLISPNVTCGRSSGQRTVASSSGVAILSQLHNDSKLHRPFVTRSSISSKRKLGVCAAAPASSKYSLPATGSTR